MMSSDNPITLFSQNVRLRACGLLIENDQILLVKHVGLGESGFLWNPPGGGLQFGESVRQAVEREFLEECGLVVEATDFVHFSEHLDDGLHALELFFNVRRLSGELKLGMDPELGDRPQMMVDLRFWSKTELEHLPASHFHKGIAHFFSPH